MARRLSVLFTPAEVTESCIRRASVGVIDVLRASTVIPTALSRGAVGVLPVAEPEEAVSLRGRLGRSNTLLCGEREGKRISGFDLGNSPLEYLAETVQGKTLVFCSTNGSRAMVRCATAPEQIVFSFVNLSPALERLEATVRDVVLVCSGKQGRTAREDVGLAGLAVERLTRWDAGFALDDGARMALDLWQGGPRDVEGLLRDSEHGVYLTSLGFGEDLAFCARIDSVGSVPVFREGRLEAAEPQPRAHADE